MGWGFGEIGWLLIQVERAGGRIPSRFHPGLGGLEGALGSGPTKSLAGLEFH